MYKKIVSFSLLLGVLTLQAMRVNTEDQDLWVIVDPKDNKEIGYLLTYNGNVPSILTTYATTVIPTAIIENETLHESLLTINAEQNISPERKRLTTALEIMETKNCNVYLETHLKEDYLKKLMPENKISLEYISHFKHGPPEKSSEKILYAIYTEKTVVNQRIAKTKPLPAPYAIYTENIANKFCNLLTQKKYPVYTFDWNLDATSHTHPLTYTHCALKQLFSKEHSVVFYPTVHTLDFHSDSKVIHHKSTSKKSPLINLIAQQALTLATANANIKNEPSILIIRNNYSNSVY